MNNKVILFVTGTLFLCANFCFGQTQKKILVVNEAEKPVPFLHVINISNNQGTYTNNDGEFEVPENWDQNSDSLQVFGLGVENMQVALHNIYQQSLLRVRSVKYNLAEIEVIGNEIDPRDIVQKALNKVDQNYYKQSVQERAFYREVEEWLMDYDTMVWNGKLIPMSDGLKITEAIIDVRNDVIRQKRKPQAILVEGRKVDAMQVVDIEMDSMVQNAMEEANMKGGIHDLLKINIHTLEELDFLSDMDDYNYVLEGTEKYGQDTVYNISFQPNDSKGKMQGRLLINRSNMAIVEVELRLSEQEKKKNRGIKLLGYEIRIRDAKIRMIFHKTDNNYQLDYCNQHLALWFSKNNEKKKVSKGKMDRVKKLAFNIRFNQEIGYQDIKAVNIPPFEKKSVLGKRDSITTEKYTPTLWNSSSIPTIPQEIVDRIESRSK